MRKFARLFLLLGSSVCNSESLFALPIVAGSSVNVDTILASHWLGADADSLVQQRSTAAPAVAAASAAVTKILGVNGHPFTQWPFGKNDAGWPEQISRLSYLGTNWYRIDIQVRVVNGQLDSTVKNDVRTLLTLASNKGIKLLPIVFASGANIQQDTVEQLFDKGFQAARAFSAEFAADFDVYDLDNESGSKAIVQPGDLWEDPVGSGVFVAYPFGGEPDGNETRHYEANRFERTKQLLDGLSKGIKAGDPTARRMFSGVWLHSGFYKRLKAAGVGFEIMGWHWYWNGDREITNVKGRDFLAEIAPLAPEIWITEMNRSEGDLGPGGTRVRDEQAQYMATVLPRYMNDPRIKAVFVYELFDQRPGNVGAAEASYGLFASQNQGSTCTPASCPVTLTEKPVASVVRKLFSPITKTLNIDNSDPASIYEAKTDGVLLLRYLLGYRDAALIANARGVGDSLRDATQIAAQIAAHSTMFDVDGDGQTLPMSDGLMILRRLLMPGTNLSDAAAMAMITANAKRSSRSDADVVRHIDALMP